VGEAHVKYGFTEQAWESAKTEATAVLAKRAKVGGIIPYSDLVRQVKAITLEPDSFALSAFLGEIFESEDAAGRGMLTVVVVHKHGDMQPGPGFFDLAKCLGRNSSDIVKCWGDELEKAHAYWST
jgi:hypothetical protein